MLYAKNPGGVFAWANVISSMTSVGALCTLIIIVGVGCDAKVALEIHNLREENPEKFYNQVNMFPSSR